MVRTETWPVLCSNGQFKITCIMSSGKKCSHLALHSTSKWVHPVVGHQNLDLISLCSPLALLGGASFSVQSSWMWIPCSARLYCTFLSCIISSFGTEDADYYEKYFTTQFARRKLAEKLHLHLQIKEQYTNEVETMFAATWFAETMFAATEKWSRLSVHLLRTDC